MFPLIAGYDNWLESLREQAEKTQSDIEYFDEDAWEEKYYEGRQDGKSGNSNT
jgi:hypothetical protein